MTENEQLKIYAQLTEFEKARNIALGNNTWDSDTFADGVIEMFNVLRRHLRNMLLISLGITNGTDWTIFQCNEFAYCEQPGCAIHKPFAGDDLARISFNDKSIHVFCPRCGTRYKIDRRFEILYKESK